MDAGLRSRLARDPWVASCACRSARRPLRRDWRQLGASSQAAQREGIRSLRGNWGDARGQFWSASGRGDGVRGAATGRGALSGLCATRGGRPRASEHAIQSDARWRRWARRDDAVRARSAGPILRNPAMLLGEGAVVNEKQLIEPPDVRNLVHLRRTTLARDRSFNQPVLLRQVARHDVAVPLQR